MELINTKQLTRKGKEILYHKRDISHFATEVFGNYGYEAITTAEISDSGNYSKGSLCIKFKNKRELFLEFVNQIFNDLERIIEESFTAINFKQIIKKYFIRLSDYFSKTIMLMNFLREMFV